MLDSTLVMREPCFLFFFLFFGGGREAYIYVCVLSLFRACRHVTVDSLPGISSQPPSSNARSVGQVLTGVLSDS